MEFSVDTDTYHLKKVVRQVRFVIRVKEAAGTFVFYVLLDKTKLGQQKKLFNFIFLEDLSNFLTVNPANLKG